MAWGSLCIRMVVGALLVVGLMGCFIYRNTEKAAADKAPADPGGPIFTAWPPGGDLSLPPPGPPRQPATGATGPGPPENAISIGAEFLGLSKPS